MFKVQKLDLRLKILGGLLLAGLLALMTVLILRAHPSELLQKPASPSGSELRVSDDRKSIVSEAFGLTIHVPDKWKVLVSTDTKDFLLQPETATDCQVHLVEQPNTTGTSATGYYNFYDLGPRFGSAAKAPQQGLITISGWQAASFQWIDKDNIRYREIYLPYGPSRLLMLKYQEDLNRLEKSQQTVPCYQDFDKLLTSISLPK